ncbi:tigger transposable element-derived protein 6 [Biomphalaria glabrata]
MLQVTCSAGSLRSQVIQYCLKEYERFAEFLTGDALAADMPPRYQFRSLLDRLEAMSETNCMVGEFEVSKTSEVIKRTIKVVDNRSGNVVTYGENFTEMPPLYVLYTSFSPCSGHYDALRKKPQRSLGRTFFSGQRFDSACYVISPQEKQQKKKEEILTSSTKHRTIFKTGALQ